MAQAGLPPRSSSTLAPRQNMWRWGVFNGDGRPDLAVANLAPWKVSVLIRNGSGGFDAPVQFDTSFGSFSVAAADFNGDGRLDLAVTNAGSDTVSVLLNTTPQNQSPVIADQA